jgi:hypothetical protein
MQAMAKVDSNGNPLVEGRKYAVRRAHQKASVVVRVEYDVDQDLMLARQMSNKSITYVVDDIDPTAIFEPVNEEAATALAVSDFMNNCDAEAGKLRQAMDELEARVCSVVGCDVGDGSETFDAVSAWLRDGAASVEEVLQCSADEFGLNAAGGVTECKPAGDAG